MAEFQADSKVLLDIARERLQTQLFFIDALDAKISTMFATGSALLGLLAAVFAVRPDEFHDLAPAVAVFGGVCYAVLTTVSIASLWARDFQTGPDLDELWEDFQLRGDKELIPDLVVDYALAVAANLTWHRLKEQASKLAIVLVVGETLALALGLLAVTS